MKGLLRPEVLEIGSCYGFLFQYKTAIPFDSPTKLLFLNYSLPFSVIFEDCSNTHSSIILFLVYARH